MKGQRTEYAAQLIFNDKCIQRVLIDQHYREDHAESMSDELILELVKSLDGGNFPIEDEDESGFQYFTVEPVIYKEKPYRVVLVFYIYDDFWPFSRELTPTFSLN